MPFVLKHPCLRGLLQEVCSHKVDNELLQSIFHDRDVDVDAAQLVGAHEDAVASSSQVLHSNPSLAQWTPASLLRHIAARVLLIGVIEVNASLKQNHSVHDELFRLYYLINHSHC